MDAVVERIEVDSMAVHLVELEGDYMKTGTQWYTADQMLIAAIVEAPIGNVFIRFSGDASTVLTNRAEFLEMIRGLYRE